MCLACFHPKLSPPTTLLPAYLPAPFMSSLCFALLCCKAPCPIGAACGTVDWPCWLVLLYMEPPLQWGLKYNNQNPSRREHFTVHCHALGILHSFCLLFWDVPEPWGDNAQHSQSLCTLVSYYLMLFIMRGFWGRSSLCTLNWPATQHPLASPFQARVQTCAIPLGLTAELLRGRSCIGKKSWKENISKKMGSSVCR